MTRIEYEKQTVETMIRLYCRRKEGNATGVASLEEGRNFYQVASLEEGRNFYQVASQGRERDLSKTLSDLSKTLSKRQQREICLRPSQSDSGEKSGNSGLCPDCQAVLDYVLARLDHCQFGNAKPTCKKCPVHCYKPDMKERIRQIMRWSGPRMLLYHPIDAIRHILREL